jgi:succinyl-CoA synthetase beta subunit
LEIEASRVLGMSINGLTVKKIFVTEKVDVKREMYLSVALDRKERSPVIVFCADGGMEINDIADRFPEKVVKIHLRGETEIKPFMVQYLLDKSGLDSSYKDRLTKIISSLLALFFGKNAMLVEINPLVVTTADELFCLDGKIDIDDNALYKFDDIRVVRDEMETNPLILEARKWDFLYIPVVENGDIDVISNGSGMLMSSIDLISKKGFEVHSVLDLGGGATAERIKEAVRIVLSEKKIRLLFVNIFGGITRCDEIAKGIEGSWDQVRSKKLVLRLEGTNKDAGAKIMRDLNPEIYLADDLVDGVDRIVKEMGR